MRQVRVAVAMGISFLSPMFGIPFESALAQDSPVLVRTVGSGAGGSEVWYVHAPSCVTTLVGETGTSGLGSLAKTGAGVLYSVNYENTLVTVDPATGQTATVAALTGLGTLSVRARTFDALGRLLAIAKNPADNSDGFGDPVKPDLQTLAFAPDGTLYGIGHGNVYAIDLATGNATIECAQVTQGGGAGSEYILSDWVPPPSLEFVTQPSDTRVGELISPAVAVRLTNAEGEPIPGVAVRLDFGVNPSGATLPEDLAISTTDASGVAVYDFLRVDLTGVGYTLVAAADLPAFGTVTGLSAPFNVAGTTSRGPRAVHIFALRLPAGACHPAYPSAQCRPTGDLLPTGPPEPDGDFWLYSFGVFDTGSEIVFINNSNPDGMSDADVLDLCGPGQVECGTNDPNLPAALEARIWGLGATVPPDNFVSDIAGQFNSPPIKVRPGNVPSLIGAPVAARAVAHIDYTTTIAREYWWLPPPGELTAPDITFYSPGAAAVPDYPLEIELELTGSFGTTGSDDASSGPRPKMKRVRLTYGGSTVDDGSYDFLYDTGATTTQINEVMAQALGLDLANPETTMELNTVSGVVVAKGYIIDRAEITADDGSRKYTIEHPMMFVVPPPSGVPPEFTFPGGIDAVIGSNYFERTRVVVDVPGLRLSIPRDIQILAPAAQAHEYAGSPSEGRRLLVRLLLDLPGLTVPGNLEVAVAGDPTTVVTEGRVGEEYWMVVNMPPKPAGCYNLTVTHADDPVTGTADEAVCFEAERVFDRALAIDRTGSMNYDASTFSYSGEKMAAARAAARFFVDLSTDVDYIGVTSFKRDSDDGDGVVEQHELARTDFQMVRAQDGATDNRPPAREAIAAIEPDGQGFAYETSIGAGLEQAWQMLRDPGQGSTAHDWEIVLLSDGRENYAPYWDRANGSGPLKPELESAAPPVRVHTVAIGGDANVTVLEDIASTTGGLFSNLYEGTASLGLTSRLADVYKAIDEHMRDEQRFYYYEWPGGDLPREAAKPLEPGAPGTIPVESGLHSLSVGFHWNENDAVDVTLLDPDGNAVSHDPPAVTLHSDSKHQAYRIADPKPGAWQYYVRPKSGLDFEFFAVASGIGDVTLILGPREVSAAGPGTFQVPLRLILVDDEPIALATVTGRARRPDGTTVRIELRDDGTSHDGASGDGIYGMLFRSMQRGAHCVDLLVEGESTGSEPFTRMRSFSFVFPEEDPSHGGKPEPPLQPEEKPGRLYYGALFGSSHPLHALDDSADANIHLRADFSYRVYDHLHIALLLGLSQFTAESDAGIGHPRWLSASLNARLLLATSGALTPYVQVGGGYYRSKAGTGVGGANVGLGVRAPLSTGYGIDLGVDYHLVGGSDEARFLTAQIGLVVH